MTPRKPPANIIQSGKNASPHSLYANLAAITNEIYKNLTKKPARVHLYNGQAAPIDESCSGQLWARLVSVTPVLSTNGCVVVYNEIIVEIGLARCISVLDEQGEAPQPYEITHDTLQALTDTTEIANTVQTLSQTLQEKDNTISDIHLESWNPLPTLGGYGGITWNLKMKKADVWEA
nr:MAG TPA: tail completion protein [Caudoviricetes sp.]